MSNPFPNNKQYDDDDDSLTDVPPPSPILYDAFKSHFDAQISRNASASSRRSEPSGQIPARRHSRSGVPSSSRSRPTSFSYSGSTTPYVSPLGFFCTPNYSPPPAVPSSPEIDYTFRANRDSSLPNAGSINAKNASISRTHRSARNGPSPSGRRDEEPGANNASYNNNLAAHPFNNPPAPASRESMTPPPAPRLPKFEPKPSSPLPVTSNMPSEMQLNSTTSYNTMMNALTSWDPPRGSYLPHPSFLLTPQTVAVPPTTYLSGTQLNPNVHTGNRGTVGYTPDSRINGYNGTFNPQANNFPLPYFMPPDMRDPRFNWSPAFAAPGNFGNTNFIAPGPSGPNVIPPFLGNPTPGAVNNATPPAVNSEFSTLLFQNANKQDGGYLSDVTQGVNVNRGEHVGPETLTMTEGNVVNATAPNAQVLSTLGIPSVDLLTITLTVLEPSTRPKRGRPPRKQEIVLALDKELWIYNPNSKQEKFGCSYKGPDCPEGCKEFTTDSKRILLRHVRKHAKREAEMPHLSQHERVAGNALAQIGELREEVQCRLSDEDLHLCQFYRQVGRRWAVMTMDGVESMKRRHDNLYHPSDIQKSNKRELRSSRSLKTKNV